MKILVCGGRDFEDQAMVFAVLDAHLATKGRIHIIQGGAKGADFHAKQWALSRKMPITTFPADWDKHGKAAGPIRNSLMLEESKPDMFVAFPGGAGTADMISKCQKAGLSGQIIK